jgi:hypothetical protein
MDRDRNDLAFERLDADDALSCSLIQQIWVLDLLEGVCAVDGGCLHKVEANSVHGVVNI